MTINRPASGGSSYWQKQKKKRCSCSAPADGLGRESRGVQHLGLLGIFSTNSVVRLEKSPKRLRYFPPMGNTRACASIKYVVHCRAVCIVRPADGYKKDRHDGRPIIYKNVEKRRTGTEAEDVGVGSRSCILILFLFHCHITGFQFTFGIYRICLQYFQFPVS